MTPGVVQVPGDVSVSEAALLLDRERMPCLLVKDSDSSFGIMTSGDIVRKVVAQGLEPHDVEIRAIMSKPVHSIECDQILDDATSVMASTGASLLIVTKQGQPVGILTVRDLALAPKRCDACLPATLRVTTGEGEGAKHSATIRQLSHVGLLSRVVRCSSPARASCSHSCCREQTSACLCAARSSTVVMSRT